MLTLYRYRIASTSGGRLFAYGFDRETAHVRIVELSSIDEAAMAGVAVDGHKVEFAGSPALDMDAGLLWFAYRDAHQLGLCDDVTPMHWPC